MPAAFSTSAPTPRTAFASSSTASSTPAAGTVEQVFRIIAIRSSMDVAEKPHSGVIHLIAE
jgi:hypothetical protein